MRGFCVTRFERPVAFVVAVAVAVSVGVACVWWFAGAARADTAEERRAAASRLAADATQGVAPQPAQVEDLYRRARAVRSERFVGMLVCEARVTGEDWDGSDPLGPVRRYMGRVELEARVALPMRTDVIRYVGPEDTNRVTFAIAGATLDTGATATVSLVDRDVFDDDPIGTFTLTYEGALPIRASSGRGQLECRGIGEDTLSDRIDAAIARADDVIEELDESGAPDAARIGFRPADAEPVEAELALYDIARFTGLADPRFLTRRDRVRAREVEHIDAVADVVARLTTSAVALGLPTELAGTNVTLRVDKYDCDVDDVLVFHPELGLDAPMECALHVTVIAESSTTLAQTFHVVDTRGNTVLLSRVGTLDESLARMRSLRVRRGETRLIFAAPIRRALLLRVARRQRVQWFRLEADAPSGPAASSAPSDPVPTPSR